MRALLRDGSFEEALLLAKGVTKMTSAPVTCCEAFMHEYQFRHFLSIDRPLDNEQPAYMRRSRSRSFGMQ
jgi:hypothetical protein